MCLYNSDIFILVFKNLNTLNLIIKSNQHVCITDHNSDKNNYDRI